MLISWEALAFVFALLPGLVGIAYCYECGRKRKPPTFAGYWSMVRFTDQAKKQAYRKTAEIFASSKTGGWQVAVLAWLFALIVALVGPSQIVTAICLVLCVPASGAAYVIGKRQPKLDAEK